jgi:catecholate siderophore receptor
MEVAMRRLRSLALLLLFLLPFPMAAVAQTAPAPALLTGKVLDPSRAPIAAARVTAVPAGPGASASAPATVTAVTNDRGEFALALAGGAYTVTVTAPGFRDLSERITTPHASTPPHEFVLEVAGLREDVTVNGAAGYDTAVISTATKTTTPLRDVPQAVIVVTHELIQDQLMMSIADVVRYVPGITSHQGENNRDQIIVRGNSSSADFFIDGVRDDVQYYRDLYNLDRVEALKGPNAMIFGRGGGGGVVNRVTKEASFSPIGAVALQAGAFGNKRVTGDVGRALNHTVAFRVNGMFEDSGSFRHQVTLERKGVSPTISIAADSHTRIRLAYEYLKDTRVADRGLPSYQNRPVDLGIDTYVGDPSQSHVHATVNLATATIEHHAGSVTIRNHTTFGDYDRGYQNFVPGAVSADKSTITLSSYNNATRRQNLFSQTDLTYMASTGPATHTFLAGAEFGQQKTDNFRNTGFFNNSTTSFVVPYAAPEISVPVTFRQSATDADNHLDTNVAAVYGQDQVSLSSHLQLLGGVRFDSFDLTYHNNRNGDVLKRSDDLVSPRAGIIVKPITPLSIYGSYSVSYLPSSGDQFSSLTTVTRQVEPEKFTNNELGLKWDARPSLSFTTALFRLNRTNTRATDPNDVTRIVQTGSTRTNGFELGVNGRVAPKWSVAGGYAYAHASITSATTAAAAGQEVAQVPHHTFSLWNHYQVQPKLGIGLGIVSRGAMFAAIDNTVVLPGYARVDAAAFYALGKRARVQLNLENLFNRRYYVNADSNTNISPGSPRALRLGMTTSF